MKYKLVIFDLDGTVLDTLFDLYSSVNCSLREYSLPERSIEEIRSFVGNGIRLLIERAVPENIDDALTDKVFEFFKLHYKEHSCDNTKPYDGVVRLIKALKSNEIKIAVVSNKADFAVKNLVKKYFDGMFDFAVGEREGIAKKPAPDSVLEAIKAFNAEKDEALYVGDSEVDIDTAKNAGIDCIAVSWGFRDEEELKKHNAPVISKCPSELLNLIISN